MNEYVLDACALLALLCDEPGADVVADAASLFMYKANLLEVYYDRYRASGKAKADLFLSEFNKRPVTIISDISDELFFEMGRLKSLYRVSFADTFALAAASVSGGTLLTSDHHEMDKVGQHEPNIKFMWIRCPDNYVIDTTEQSVKIKENTLHTLDFYDEPLGGLQILKKGEDGKPVPNTEFSVAKMNGERIGVYTTDNYGQINIPGLDDGWYTVTEIRAADGYLLDAAPRNIEVKGGGLNSMTVVNKKAASILLRKTDSVTGKGIYGVTFLLYDKDKNPIRQYVSDQSGSMSTSEPTSSSPTGGIICVSSLRRRVTNRMMNSRRYT
jgi:predicted nucleic acid-binding protein